MRRFAFTLIPALSLLTAPGAFSPAAAGEPVHPSVPTSLVEAKDLAGERNLPILLRMAKGWCTDCYAFDMAYKANTDLQETLADNVVLCAVDITKGEGAELAEVYSVSDYRMVNFILADKDGEVMDRWTDFHSAESFITHLTSAVENPIKVKDRQERFAKTPTETDARKLGELRYYEGYPAEAVAYYRRAQALNPKSDVSYDNLVLEAMARGFGQQLFGLDDVRHQADVILASDRSSPKHLIDLAYVMGKVGKKAEDGNLYLPYLKAAIERTESATDADVQKMRANLLPEYALQIKKNASKAIEYKKEAFAQAAAPKDWRENANMLNNLAWWCFENKLNLDEAGTLARRGIELAQPGTQKANILDTLAEICNLSGRCGEAVDYARLAVTEAPDNEYFQKQVTRFEALLAEQSR